MKKLFLTSVLAGMMAPAAFAAVIDDFQKNREVASVEELKPGECAGLANLPLVSSLAETRSGKACPRHNP